MKHLRSTRLNAWLRLFRVQNLVTVPGDVLVGAAACGALTFARAADVALVCLASVLMYLYGLVDNDLVGAATDPKSRPLAAGEISLRAARCARTACLGFAVLDIAAGLSAVLGLATALGVVVSAGSHAQQHDRGQQQSRPFFHNTIHGSINSFLFYCIFIIT